MESEHDYAFSKKKLKLEQFEPCSGTPITSYLDDASTTDPSADPLEPPDPLALSWGEDLGCADGQQTDDGKVQGLGELDEQMESKVEPSDRLEQSFDEPAYVIANVEDFTKKNVTSPKSHQELQGIASEDVSQKKKLDKLNETLGQSPKYKTFASLTEGFVFLDSMDEESTKVCMRYSFENAQLKMRVYLASLVQLEEINRLSSSKIKQQLKRMENIRVCEGIEEEVILPLIKTHKHVSLLMIDCVRGKFRYRTRQCTRKIRGTGLICAECSKIFLQEFAISEAKSDKSGNLFEVVSPQELKDKLQKQKYKQRRQQRRQKKLLQKHRKLLRKKNGENSSPQQQQQQHPQQQQPTVTNEFPEAATAQLKDDLILDASGGHTLSVASHQCELCNTEFSCLDKLYQHTRSCHQLIQKKCLFCTEEFEAVKGEVSSNKAYVEHLMVRHGVHVDQPVVRDVLAGPENCLPVHHITLDPGPLEIYQDKSMVSLEKAEDQLERGLDPLHCCHVCGKTFEKQSTLVGHLKIHSSGHFVCPECGAKFKVERYLQRHMNSHDKDKAKYPCDVCDKKFCRPYLVEQHIRFTHNKDLPFKCTQCDHVARTQTRLNMHIRAVHTREKPFPCEICGFKSSRMDNLNAHRLKRHPHIVTSKLTRLGLVQLVSSGQHKFCADASLIPSF